MAHEAATPSLSAGRHHLLMIGPPGSGKTMLARRLPSILPTMVFREGIEVTKIHSIAGTLDGTGIVTRRPFRSPHHTVSDVALVGGGSTPKPGQVSLAHHGVLFLDEMPEFTRSALEALRQPLEDGVITVSRSAMTCEFPARFMLCGSMNPCPHGFLIDIPPSPSRVASCLFGMGSLASWAMDTFVSILIFIGKALAFIAIFILGSWIKDKVFGEYRNWGGDRRWICGDENKVQRQDAPRLRPEPKTINDARIDNAGTSKKFNL